MEQPSPTEKPQKEKRKYMHRTGRPPAFTSPEQFASQAERYFKECKGKGRGWARRPSKAGLCWWLGINKDTLNEYSKKPDYSGTVKEAYGTIELAWIDKLDHPYPTGGIFYLKNAFKEDYRDRYDHTTDGKELPAPVFVMPSGKESRMTRIMEKRKNKS